MKRYIKSAEKFYYGADLAKMTRQASKSKDPEELDRLSRLTDKFDEIKMAVARNPNISQQTLLMLSKHPNQFVRRGIASNPHINSSILRTLANDESDAVRRQIVETHFDKLPQDIVRQLEHDPSIYVRSAFDRYTNGSDNISEEWPSSTTWLTATSEEFEELWQEYLADTEDEVNSQYDVETEISAMFGEGTIDLYFEKGHVSIDLTDWSAKEAEMASKSKSAGGYRRKYASYIKKLQEIAKKNHDASDE